MRYIALFVWLILIGLPGFAQEKSEVKSVISSSASRVDNLGHVLTTSVQGTDRTVIIQSVSLQVGMPYMGVIDAPFANNPTQEYRKDLGFPWSTLYKYKTFSQDFFTVSKGYYSDKIELNWEILDNLNQITGIQIYRTKDITSANPVWGNAIKTLPAETRTFIDTNIEGGKLYKYKVKARGVEEDSEIELVNYISGIGYRNPSGIITGMVRYSGGSPVKDVVVSAQPVGGVQSFGSSLKVAHNTHLMVSKLHEPLSDALALQMWVKPETTLNGRTLELFHAYSDQYGDLTMRLSMSEIEGSKRINVTLGGYECSLSTYIPNGEVDNQGDDVLVDIEQINTAFNHFSAVIRDGEIPEIYINGRLISSAYVTEMNVILEKYNLETPKTVVFTENSQAIALNTTPTGESRTWTHLTLGGETTAYIDEIRLWDEALDAATIKTDFRRYLLGNENSLHTYIRANEGTGEFAYDLARTGFDFHGNDARLSSEVPVLWANEAQFRPTSSQLGILGITNESGNYVIASVPYLGNGEAFTVVPSFGKHKFNPNDQIVFVGNNSSVVNKIDFEDESSFQFKGIVVYDSRGVFPPTDDAPITGDIKDDEFYNAYTVGNRKYPKGEYWAETAENGETVLLRYAPIPVPNANVYIDGQQAMDKNNAPVVTDQAGNFTIQVPIGEHAISVSKGSHTFDFEGRYPANQTDTINGEVYTTNYYAEFFEDRNEKITFIDNTKINVVGRVVGGEIQAGKSIGFGYDGEKTITSTDEYGVEQTTTYTSINNIGQANITFSHVPMGNSSSSPEYEKSILTHPETGEFRVSLLPINYLLSQEKLTFVSGINPNNTALLDQDQILNYTTINAPRKPRYDDGLNTVEGTEEYNESLSFVYYASPKFDVINQTSEENITVDNQVYSLDTRTAPLVYNQFYEYTIQIEGYEEYINHDLGTPVIDKVPVTDAELIATNNIALAGSESIEADPANPLLLNYSFSGGMPSNSADENYNKRVDLQMKKDGINYEVNNYINLGLVLGGVSDGSQTFVTAGPEKADIILRDPPGSLSSATIESGTSFVFTETGSIGTSVDSSYKLTTQLGATFQIGGGLAGPVTKTEGTIDNSNGYGVSTSSEFGNEKTKTYTFNQSISTSDDPNWVGSSADLYIGYSANQFYGSYNRLQLSTVANDINALQVKNSDSVAVSLYPKYDQAMYFTESEEKTLFIYSQYQIMAEIIPRYQEFIRKIDAGELTENENGVLSRTYYASSIKLWRQVILLNEASKYQAFQQRDELKGSLEDLINGLPNDQNAAQLAQLLNDNFYENISFDGGVGGFTKSIESQSLRQDSYTFEFDLDTSFAQEFGWNINGFGNKAEYSADFGISTAYGTSSGVEETTTFNYTLKDSDNHNFFSIDVVNPMDGNGPIFATIGGETSCPYEPEERAYFYTPTQLSSSFLKQYFFSTQPLIPSSNQYSYNYLLAYYYNNEVAEINPLAENQRTELSMPTVAIELPNIEVVRSVVANVPDGRNAEFTLKLSNLSVVEQDAQFRLYVDQSTNPYNAALNIGPEGVPVTIPYGTTVDFLLTLAKVKEDQFDYENIKISLESECNSEVLANTLSEAPPASSSGHVYVSATFVPACSKVEVSSPANYWVYNRAKAFNGSTTIPLNITLNEYNLTFDSLEKIQLQFRRQGTPNWVGLRTYYKSQASMDRAEIAGEENVELISGAETSFDWDIIEQGLSDGMYEIRAVSQCTNGTSFDSLVITGKIDLTPPRLFATPTPNDNVLNIGDDIKLVFNESVQRNGTVSRFEFLVQENQLAVDHGVSLAFNGMSNVGRVHKPAISNGDFSLEFWLKNMSSGPATIIEQANGLSVQLSDNSVIFTLGGEVITADVPRSTTFEHYTFSYDEKNQIASIIVNDVLVKQVSTPRKLVFTNSSDLIIGGNTFQGNLHDLRIWKKHINRDEAVSQMNQELIGNESQLIGYWPMNEGSGTLAHDVSRFKHMTLENTTWDIKPKGTSYYFDGSNYLTFDRTSLAVISSEMDATMSFWMKTSQPNGTVLSNGKGDGTDVTGSNGKSDKWSLNMNQGVLSLEAEGNSYPMGDQILNDDQWHHLSISLSRNSTTRMYVDGAAVASYSTVALGGFSAGYLFIGARGQESNDGSILIDRPYEGYIDELRLWNTAKTQNQISEDRYFEMDIENPQLILYAPFNAPEQENNNGPKYYVPVNSFSKESHYALMQGSPQSFSEVTPGVKPYRPTVSIGVDAVFSDKEILLVPDISNWASVEGKVANVTVSGLQDASNNTQASPITWSFFIEKNPVKWFVTGHPQTVNLTKRINEKSTFEITLVNQGINSESYVIDLPDWIDFDEVSGTLAPNSTKIITANIDDNLAVGDYHAAISLSTSYDYTEVIQLEVRVLERDYPYTFDPNKFDESMTIVGKVNIDGVLATDIYNKVLAIYQGEVRGVANLEYDRALDEYFVYLTVYSNNSSDSAVFENLLFYIYDATEGKLQQALIDGANSVLFSADQILGNPFEPVIFSNSTIVVQNIELNKGWTWVSFHVDDLRFSQLNQLTSGLNLSNADVIKSKNRFDSYYIDGVDGTNNGWNGTISSSGGINSGQMYKWKLSEAQRMIVQGPQINLNTWTAELTANWNWLPFPGFKNARIQEALAELDVSEGDFVKSQSEFAIYSETVGWKGTLEYFRPGQGYMIKLGQAQTFAYPPYINTNTSKFERGESLVPDQKKSRLLDQLQGYPNTMSAVIQLPQGYTNMEITDQSGQIRSISTPQKVEENNLFFTTIFGEESEKLQLILVSDNGEKEPVTTVEFAPDHILGTLKNPWLIEVLDEHITLYPNPFAHEFELNIEAKNPQTMSLEITHISGRVMFVKNYNLHLGTNIISVNPNLNKHMPDGIYLLKVSLGEKVYLKKIVKQ